MIAVISMAALLTASTLGRHAPLAADSDSVVNAMLDCTRVAVASSARSTQVWPGFLLLDQVILLVNERDGPVVLVTDGSPPRGYRSTAAGRSIYERDGAPPDSLLGLQIGRRWAPARRVATVVPFQKRACPEMVVHEAFHTYQRFRVRNRAGESWGEGTQQFPAADEESFAAQMLEGHYLARALAIRDLKARSNNVALAAVAHDRFCEIVGQGACRDVSKVEETEGSAAYVAMASLLGQSRSSSPRLLSDSLRARLERVTDSGQLGRGYAFWIGASWMALAAQAHSIGWQQVIEQEGLSELTRRITDVAQVSAPSAGDSASLRESLDSLRRIATQLLRRSRTKTDSARHAFAKAGGIVVLVGWTPGGKSSSHIRSGPAGIETEYTVRFGDGPDVLAVDGPFQRSCCPPLVRAKANASDLHLIVSGRVVERGSSVRGLAGPVKLYAAHLHLTYHSAAVTEEGDSIFIQLNPAIPRHNQD